MNFRCLIWRALAARGSDNNKKYIENIPREKWKMADGIRNWVSFFFLGVCKMSRTMGWLSGFTLALVFVD